MRRALVALATLAAMAAFPPPAGAALKWDDGVVATSSVDNCLTPYITEAGVGVYVGQYVDASSLPRPGDVFYGHAVFEGLTNADCPVTSSAELDLVLPPGVRVAPDAQHTIHCFYSDDGGATEHQTASCPTHTVTGTYGPMLPPHDGGGPWTLPVGRIFEVQFPLVSNRGLDVTGGNCQASLYEVINDSSDCLVVALHVADGQSDPWLLPHKQLFVQPASNRFSFVKVVPNKRHGTATLLIKVPDAGTLRVAKARGLRGTRKVASRAGKVKLAVRPGGKLKRRLRKRGRVKTSVKVTFFPRGGEPLTKGRKLTLVLKR